MVIAPGIASFLKISAQTNCVTGGTPCTTRPAQMQNAYSWLWADGDSHPSGGKLTTLCNECSFEGYPEVTCNQGTWSQPSMQCTGMIP